MEALPIQHLLPFRYIMIAVALGAGLHAARIRTVPMFGQRETADAFARDQARQPAFVLLGRAERMDRMNGKRPLHRRQRTQTGIGPFQFLHDQAVGSVTQSRAAVLF